MEKYRREQFGTVVKFGFQDMLYLKARLILILLSILEISTGAGISQLVCAFCARHHKRFQKQMA